MNNNFFGGMGGHQLGTLESNQAAHNYGQSNFKNFSGSNDMQQMKHDTNEQLIRGAEVLGHGRRMGLNDDQLLQMARGGQLREDLRYGNTESRHMMQSSKTNVADHSIAKEMFRRGR